MTGFVQMGHIFVKTHLHTSPIVVKIVDYDLIKLNITKIIKYIILKYYKILRIITSRITTTNVS